MFRKFHEKLKEREEGFTLIELLVVILIIAILAAIAIPIFLRQREKGYIADLQSTLKNGATAAESYATGTTPPGDYSGLDGDDGAILLEEGLANIPDTQTVDVEADANEFCIVVSDTRVPDTNDWNTGVYWSGAGRPQPEDTCADAGYPGD